MNENVLSFLNAFFQLLIDLAAGLLGYLVSDKLISGDRIICTNQEITNNLINQGWDGRDVLRALDFILNINIEMIDNGQQTDSFFIHFAKVNPCINK
jgi:hypothetical protein